MFSEILVLNPWKSPVETARSDTAPCGKMFVVLGEIAQGDPCGDGEKRHRGNMGNLKMTNLNIYMYKYINIHAYIYINVVFFG